MKQFLVAIIVITSFTLLNAQILVGQSDVTQSVSNAGNARYQDEPYLTRLQIAKQTSKQLNQGTLIVRLTANNAKIEYLTNKGKTQKAQELIEIRNANHSWIMSEFRKDYSFSKVLFIYGNNLKEYLNGKSNPEFINEKLEVDPSIQLDPGPAFILAAQAGDLYYLYDINFNRIPEPIPHGIDDNVEYITKRNALGRFFSRLASADRSNEVFRGVVANDSVKYFNDKLFAFLVSASQ